ncbi:MAG: hypothetical protein PF444_09350, partial [Bacteroidales bacterium]|nr:hypothetical protein [Bacteroidales bacterium]
SRAVSHWKQETGVTEKATEKLARAHEQLGKAVGKLDPITGKVLLTQKEMDKVMARLRTQYAEQLDPIKYVMDAYDKQAKALQFVGDSATEYTVVLKQQTEWRDKNIEYDQKDIENLKEKVKRQDELTRSQRAMDAVLQATTYAQRGSSDKIQAVGALSKGYTDPSGNTTKISKGQTGAQVVDIFGADNMKGTQEYYDAQLQIYQDFQAKIDEAQQAGIISEQTANQLKMENFIQHQQSKADVLANGLDTLAGLMGSHNKTAFKIGQAAAIAQVAIKTPEAAMNAYNSLSGIPYVGPFLGAAAAAAAVVMGVQQIAKIRSQQPPAFATGGSYMVGGGGGVDSKRITFDATPGEIININTPSQAKALEQLAKDKANNHRGVGVQNLNVTVVQQGRPDRRTPEQNARQMRRAAMKLMEQN